MFEYCKFVMLSEVKWMLIEGMVCHDSLDIFIMEWKVMVSPIQKGIEGKRGGERERDWLEWDGISDPFHLHVD